MNCKKIFFWFVIPISIFLGITPSLTQELDEETSLKIEEYLSTGKSLYRQDKFQEAIEVWQKVLEIDPANSQAQRYIERAKERLHELQPTPPPKELPTEVPKVVPSPPSEKIIPEVKPPIPTPPVDIGFPLAEKPPGLLALKECIQIAIDNSISLKTAKREIKLAKQKAKDAWRALFPAASIKWEEISGTTTGEDFKGREFYLELQQPIYQGGRLVNTLNQARINMQVARSNYQKLKNDLVYEVEQAYHILASTKKTYRELVELITLAKQDYSVAEKEYELELQREIDFLNVKNLYQETEYKLLSNQKDLTLAYLTLYQTLNLDPKKQSVDIPEPPPPKILEINIDECQKLALENRPDLAIKDSLLKFNKYGMQIARSGNRLKIDLTAAGGYKDEVFITEDLDLQTEWYVGLKGSIPIWLNTAEYSFISQDKVPSAGQTTSTEFQSHTATLRLFDNTTYTSITEARVNLEKAKDELQKLEKSITFEVKQDFYEYEKAVYQLANSSTKLRLGEVELAIVSAQRDLSLATTNDLLRTRIKLWEAKTGYHQATAGYFTSVAKINKTIGVSEYFDPMGEPTAGSAYYISPPPLDISIARLGVTPAEAGESRYEKPGTQLAYAGQEAQPTEKQPTEKQDVGREKAEITEPYQNFRPRKALSESKPAQQTEVEAESLRRQEDEAQAESFRRQEEKRLAQLKKEEEKQRLAQDKEQKRQEELKRKEEEKRLAQIKKDEEKKKREEEKRLTQLKEEEERKKKEEEQQRLAQEREQKRQEELKRKEEEKRLAQIRKEEEKKKREEEKRLAQIKKDEAQAESLRRQEEKRLAQLKKEEEQQRLAQEREQKRQEELKRKEEEKRLAQIRKDEEKKKREEEKRLTQLKEEEERKKKEEEQQRLAQDKEQKRQEELKRKEEEKRLAQIRKDEEKKKREEEKRLTQLKEEEEKQILAQEKQEKEQIQIIEQIRKEQEKILAQLKEEEEERKKVQSQVSLTSQEEQVLDESRPSMERRDEYARAKILAGEIVKRKAEEQKRKADQTLLMQEREQKRQKELKRKEEEKRLAQLKKEEERKKREEEKRLAQIKKDEAQAESIRRQEEKRLVQIKKEEEKQRLAQEREQKRQEELKRKQEEKRLAELKKEEEKKKRSEEKRLAQLKKEEEKKKREEERQRLAQEKEQKKQEEIKRREEEKRITQLKKEEKRQKREEEKRLAQLKEEEEKKKKEEQKKTIQAVVTDTKSPEYELALTKAEEKLLQLEEEKTLLLAKLEDKKAAQQTEINKYLLQGKQYYEKQDYASAIKEWSKALALDPTNTEAQEGIRRAEEQLRKTK